MGRLKGKVALISAARGPDAAERRFPVTLPYFDARRNVQCGPPHQGRPECGAAPRFLGGAWV
jgi:hypothetical protein